MLRRVGNSIGYISKSLETGKNHNITQYRFTASSGWFRIVTKELLWRFHGVFYMNTYSGGVSPSTLCVTLGIGWDGSLTCKTLYNINSPCNAIAVYSESGDNISIFIHYVKGDNNQTIDGNIKLEHIGTDFIEIDKLIFIPDDKINEYINSDIFDIDRSYITHIQRGTISIPKGTSTASIQLERRVRKLDDFKFLSAEINEPISSEPSIKSLSSDGTYITLSNSHASNSERNYVIFFFV